MNNLCHCDYNLVRNLFWPYADDLAGCVPPQVRACGGLFSDLPPPPEIRKKQTSSFYVRRAGARTKSGVRAPQWCAPPDQGLAMNTFFNDLQDKINQAIENSPAKDIERNVKAMMTQGFSKLDLVTREEFDIQAQVLAKTRAKLEALELRMAELEAKLSASEHKV
jgi:BMFP domain-containing protein YqiC